MKIIDEIFINKHHLITFDEPIPLNALSKIVIESQEYDYILPYDLGSSTIAILSDNMFKGKKAEFIR